MLSKLSTKTLVKIEVLLPILFLGLHLVYYTIVASLAGSEGKDFGYLISTKLDQIIPIITIFVIPYTLIAVTNPLIAVWCIVAARGFDRDVFRRVYFGIFLMIIIAYTVYLLFPVDYLDYSKDANLHGVFLGGFVQAVHNTMSLWNSFPSFHVMLPWFLYRMMQMYAKQFAWLFLIMSILISLATLFIKVHYIADVVSGILVAEIAYEVVLRLENNKVFSKLTEITYIRIYTTLLVVLLLGLIPLRHLIQI